MFLSLTIWFSVQRLSTWSHPYMYINGDLVRAVVYSFQGTLRAYARIVQRLDDCAHFYVSIWNSFLVQTRSNQQETSRQ